MSWFSACLRHVTVEHASGALIFPPAEAPQTCSLLTLAAKKKWYEVRAEWRPCRVASLPPSVVYYVQRSSSLIESLCTSSAKLGRITFQWLHTSYSSTRLPPFLPYLRLVFALTAVVHVGLCPCAFLFYRPSAPACQQMQRPTRVAVLPQTVLTTFCSCLQEKLLDDVTSPAKVQARFPRRVRDIRTLNANLQKTRRKK